MKKYVKQDLLDLDYHSDLVARPAAEEVIELAESMVQVMKAHATFMEAKKSVPNYLGDSTEELYFYREEDEYNRAAERHADAVLAVFREAMA